MASDWQNSFDDAHAAINPGDPLGQQGSKDAQEQLLKRYDEMRKNFQAYRPEAAGYATNALQQQLGAFNPLNDLLKRMYGQGAGFDLASLGQNPIHGADQRTPAQQLFGQFQNGYGEQSAQNLLGTGDPNLQAGQSGDVAAGVDAAGTPPRTAPTPLSTPGRDATGRQRSGSAVDPRYGTRRR